MKIVGLLRGINVGKSVKVPMNELKNLLEDLGMTAVATYLNSGNVVFCADQGLPELRPRLEAMLAQRFGKDIPILLLEGSSVITIANAIPAEWENNQQEQTYVAYLFPEADRASLIDELPIKHQFLEIRYMPSALIWHIKRENYHRSQITKIASHPSYAYMTTRNVNTARKLAELCQLG